MLSLISVYRDRKFCYNLWISLHSTMNLLFTLGQHFDIMRGLASFQNSGLNKHLASGFWLAEKPLIGHCVPEINRYICDWPQCSTQKQSTNTNTRSVLCEAAAAYFCFVVYVYLVFKVKFPSSRFLPPRILNFVIHLATHFLKVATQGLKTTALDV